MLRPGFATPLGTRRYAGRIDHAAPGHFGQAQGLSLSGVGIGTYLGEADGATDERYRQALVRAVAGGVNVIDTASIYRFQRSERVIGQAMAELEAAGYARDELFIATKGGYLPFAEAPTAEFRRCLAAEILAPGLATADEIVEDHCLAPAFIRHQLAASRQNLGLATLDAYYLHNPEAQLAAVDQRTFERRMRAAFEVLEAAVEAGQLVRYGVATWDGFRLPPSAKGYHGLARLVDLARDVAGERHHFGIVQLPFNLVMTEGWTVANQGGRSTLEAARDLGLMVMTSASILQAQLARGLPPTVGHALSELQTDAQRALQVTRSAPGVTTALVGMSRVVHVDENLQLVRHRPLSADRFARLMAGAPLALPHAH